MTRTPTPKPTDTAEQPKTKQTSDGVKAGQLFNKLQRLDADEKAEIENAPASIAVRYRAKRDVLLAAASDDVRALVRRMRGEPTNAE